MGYGGVKSTTAAYVPFPDGFCIRIEVWPGHLSYCETLSHCLYDTQIAEACYAPGHAFNHN